MQEDRAMHGIDDERSCRLKVSCFRPAPPRLTLKPWRLLVLHCVAALVAMTTLFARSASAQDVLDGEQQQEYRFSQLQRCNESSFELARLGVDDELEPCILFDMKPSKLNTSQRTTVVTMIQVTPSSCHDHRDGVPMGVKALNNDNNGQGVAIGYNQDYFIQFRFVEIIAGNTNNLAEEEYDARHRSLLNNTLQELSPQYIVGTCSWKASLEPDLALHYKTILMAQVGPPGFYQGTQQNPYLFGFHINSDNYPIPAVQSLGFYADREHIQMDSQPIKVVYRTESEFFRSTCRSAMSYAKSLGFTDIADIAYDPYDDHDGDGEINSFDEDFLISVADEACPPGSATIPDGEHHPAIFACTIVEQDVLLKRWRENGCRPAAFWGTFAVWGWAYENLDALPQLQGGGQWHEAFDYSDSYFASGSDLLAQHKKEFGYAGSYDIVAGYSMAVLFSQHIAASYRIADNPNVAEDFLTDNGYEMLRRDLMVLTADTLFGPFALNANQRNVGRGAAGSQWLPHRNSTDSYRNKCISPLSQAEATSVVPSAAAKDCKAGEFLSKSRIASEDSVLSCKCMACPVDTLSLETNNNFECSPCPMGSTTEGKEGSKVCISSDPHLFPTSVKVLGYLFVGITWSLAFVFIIWLLKHRRDPVVTISQRKFLILICVGAIISSSSIIAMLAVDVEPGEDATAASRACRSIPFLYFIGWVLQYSSLCAKSCRLFKLASAKNFRRAKLGEHDMVWIIALALLCDLIIVVVWTLTDALQYKRTVVGTDIDREMGLLTVESVGQCQSGSDVSIWAYVCPILVLHLSIMVGTAVVLWKLRCVEDRYQENKYVAMASLYLVELLVVGLPVFWAVGDSTSAKFIVMSSIIFLNDAGILCFIFIPKIIYVAQGLPEGVSVGESVLESTMRSAVHRHSSIVSTKRSDIDLVSRSFSSADQENSYSDGIEGGEKPSQGSSQGFQANPSCRQEQTLATIPSEDTTSICMIAKAKESEELSGGPGNDERGSS